MTPTLEQLIEHARNHVWTEDERREHAVSFAYGNLKLSGIETTKESLRKTYDEIHGVVGL